MNIIIYGNEKDTVLSDILLKVLSKYGGVNLFSTNRWTRSPKTYTSNFFVYDINKLPTVIDMDGIFIFKDSFKSINTHKLCSNFLHIINSQNMRAIKHLKSTEQVVMTCGIDSKSTLTFSSLTTTEAIVNLQRYVKTKNKILEPHEFPLKIKTPCDETVLLLVCAVLLLAELPSLEGFEV